jgi:hypothetical protein
MPMQYIKTAVCKGHVLGCVLGKNEFLTIINLNVSYQDYKQYKVVFNIKQVTKAHMGI